MGSSGTRYRVLQPDAFKMPEGHEHLDGQIYLAREANGVDALEEVGLVEVLDWEDPGDGEEVVSYAGPPEPVERDDGTIELVYVFEDTTRAERPTNIKTQELGVWTCLRDCGGLLELGVEGGELVEPHTCPVCERQGPFGHVGPISAKEAKAALRGSRIWHLPSGVDDEGYRDLWDDVQSYIRDHWDAGDGEGADATYAGLTAFAISTWVRENLTFVPHLMLMGKTTGGKTRLLNTLARVSYRSVVSASATPASMFRLIDAYDVSYYVSEYHGLHPDTRRELDAVVRAGQKRGEVATRAEPTANGHEPMVFDPFAHIAIATQFKPDDDIVNRCIQVNSSSPSREMPAVLDEDRGRALRDRLLHARYRLLESEEWRDAETEAYATLAKRGITKRTREKLLTLMTTAYVWDAFDEFEPFIDVVVGQDREAASESVDALVVEAIRDLAHEKVGDQAFLGDGDPYGTVRIPYSDEEYGKGVIERYEDMTGYEKTPAWLGHVVKRLDLEKDRTMHGTVITDPELGPKLRELCEDLNLPWIPDREAADTVLSQDEAIDRLFATFDELANEAADGLVPFEDVLDALDGEIGDRDVEHLIENACARGEIYEPQDGYLRRTS